MSNPRPESEQSRKLFVGGLNRNTSEETLKAYFEQYGEVMDCKVIRDAHTRRSRGFAFITYKLAYMVDDAQAAKPHEIDGRNIEPKRAVPRELLKQPEYQMTLNKLYVGGLSENIEEEHLREHFSPYGNILKVSIISDRTTGKKRGFAFIDFDDYDPVDKAALQSHVLKGKKIDVNKGLSKQDIENIVRAKHGARSRRGYGGVFAGSLGDYGNRYGSPEYGSGGMWPGYHSANVYWSPVHESWRAYRGRGRSSSYSGRGYSAYFGRQNERYFL